MLTEKMCRHVVIVLRRRRKNFRLILLQITLSKPTHQQLTIFSFYGSSNLDSRLWHVSSIFTFGIMCNKNCHDTYVRLLNVMDSINILNDVGVKKNVQNKKVHMLRYHILNVK